MCMAQTFIGSDVWEAIAETLSRSPRGKRFAAVAFLGPSAPSLLKLRKGDVLVVNASDQAVRSRSTSPEAIAGYLATGVLVYNVTDLHAKVIATKRHAVVGSANASEKSRAQALEAVLITDAARTVTQVREFVQDLAVPGKELNTQHLPKLWRLWEEGESNDPTRAVPGVNGGREKLITDTSAGFVIECTDWPEIDPTTIRKVGQGRRRVPRAPHHGVDWVVLESADPGYKVGQVVYFYDEDWLHPPCVIATAPRPLPDSSGRQFQWFRYCNAHRELEWDHVENTLHSLLKKHLAQKGWWEGSFDAADGIGTRLLDLWPEFDISQVTDETTRQIRPTVTTNTELIRPRPKRVAAVSNAHTKQSNQRHVGTSRSHRR